MNKLLYLVTSLPLGLIYFVFLIAGISVGLVTLIIWVGVAILIFMMLAWWQLAGVERWLAVRWLHVDVPLMTVGSPPQLLSRRLHYGAGTQSNDMEDPGVSASQAPLWHPLFRRYGGITDREPSRRQRIARHLRAHLTFVLLALLILSSPSPAQRLRHYVAFAAMGLALASWHLL